MPQLADFVVELVSTAFGRLPDPVLLPWLPTLIGTLRAGGAELVPLLIREAGRMLPGRLADLDAWVPPWLAEPAPALVPPAPGTGGGAVLLAAYPAACDAVAELLGREGTWAPSGTGGPGAVPAGRHPQTAAALAALLTG